MVAGLVSFAAQLLLSKFFQLFKLSLNLKEILGDLLGLLISVVGLVLTTQAAAQNSTFPENAIARSKAPSTHPSLLALRVAVVSSAIVGAVLGLVFCWWGQQQEFSAARSRSKRRPLRVHKVQVHSSKHALCHFRSPPSLRTIDQVQFSDAARSLY